ncbi:hypothetical protein U9R90_00825 [Streptomyces sp. E11-3]|uniref:hypothetical protein n=1 Tax=Streptomyces sp. E11-3 TaxID=3110112 RepID=UPI0039803116
MSLAAAPVRRTDAMTSRAALVMASVAEDFLTSICWDPVTRMVVSPQNHPQLGWRPLPDSGMR